MDAKQHNKETPLKFVSPPYYGLPILPLISSYNTRIASFYLPSKRIACPELLGMIDSLFMFQRFAKNLTESAENWSESWSQCQKVIANCSFRCILQQAVMLVNSYIWASISAQFYRYQLIATRLSTGRPCSKLNNSKRWSVKCVEYNHSLSLS